MLRFMNKNPKIKKTIGIVLVLIGFIALITPFTPGWWLIFLGLEFLGFRFLLWEKIKTRYLHTKSDEKKQE